MSAEQLSAFLEALQADAGLQEKLKGIAGDLEATVGIAKEAGFDVSTEDWLKILASQELELSDEELADVSGGNLPLVVLYAQNRPIVNLFGGVL
jgi:predicted ribosomally synthesized peptide with nif11-like leader